MDERDNRSESRGLSDRASSSRARDAEILAALERRQRGRWRRHYAVGAALAVVFIGASLAQLGVPFALGAAAAGLFVAVVWATERLLDRRRSRRAMS